jgi:hypothetical protein
MMWFLISKLLSGVSYIALGQRHAARRNEPTCCNIVSQTTHVHVIMSYCINWQWRMANCFDVHHTHHDHSEDLD